MPPSSENPLRVYTIGHSNHTWEKLLQLLQNNHIETVVDVRSRPYSRFHPYFVKKWLEKLLAIAKIHYVYLGKLLGGMPEEDEYYDDEGYVLYDRLVDSPRFQVGILRIEEIITQSRIALMCAEEDPHKCHRRFLIGAALVGKGIELWHIRKDGVIDVDRPSSIWERSDDSVKAHQLSLFYDPNAGRWKSCRPVRKRV